MGKLVNIFVFHCTIMDYCSEYKRRKLNHPYHPLASLIQVVMYMMMEQINKKDLMAACLGHLCHLFIQPLDEHPADKSLFLVGLVSRETTEAGLRCCHPLRPDY